MHEPHHFSDEPKFARLFHSDWLEALSMTVWWAVPAVWVPVALLLWVPWLISSGTSSSGGGGSIIGSGSPLEAASMLLCGVAIWSFVEYMLHRFVFHLDELLPRSGWLLTGHFLLHGVHHRVPMDRFRLVMPPAMTLIISTVLFCVFRGLFWGLSSPQYMALFASGMLG